MPPKSRQNENDQDRDGGRFARKCGAIIHNTSDVHVNLQNIFKGKKIRASTYEYLLQNEIITSRASYICKKCVENVEANLMKVRTISDMSESESEVETSETKNATPFSESFDASKKLDHQIKNDIATLFKDQNKCNIENLLHYKPDQWLKDRPPELVALIKDLCQFTSGNERLNESFLTSKIIELIYGCRNSRLVLPLSFQENLLTYSVSRNKKMVLYNSRHSPGATYDHISKWMTEQALTEIEFPPGIVRTVFDNEQVIGKTYQVRTDNKVPSSICTSHIYISIDQSNPIQDDHTFAPETWLYSEPNEEQQSSYLNDDPENINLFRDTRNDFIASRLNILKLENIGNQDFIDRMVQEIGNARAEKTCVNCGGQNESTARKCTNCGGSLTKEQANIDIFVADKSNVNPYCHFDNVQVKSNKITVKTGEPDLLNPNSFDTISKILFNLGERAGINQYTNKERQWIFLECDGGIYHIVDNLLFNVYRCTQCKCSFYGKDSFTDHRCSILHSIEPVHEFGWIIPMPGLLHIEINACKAFFETNWDVMMSAICSKFGFNSLKALEYAKHCGDHHKSWEILEILYIAAADELLLPYIRYCEANSLLANVDGYWEWSNREDFVDPNYLYMQQMILTYLHALMLFRIGCRRGNALAISSAKSKIMELLMARAHSRYHRILALDRYIMTMMPKEIASIVENSLTLSRTNNIGHYQGGDACLEEVNRAAKSWIPPVGVPSDETWVKVFRNLDNLNELTKLFLADPPERSNHSRQSGCINYKEIAIIRALFRQNYYLCSPFEDRLHTNVNGSVVLNDSLHEFSFRAKANKDKYLRSLLDKEDCCTMDFVCITKHEQERKNQIENKTKKEILKRIMEKLEQMSQTENVEILEEYFNKCVKPKNKDAYIQFNYTLCNEEYHSLIQQ